MKVIRLAAALTRMEIETLERSLEGELFYPGEGGYERARAIFNGMIERHPAFVVRCAGPGDAMQAIAFACRHGVPLSIRGGGHAIAGAAVCDDGIVLDMRGLDNAEVDLDRHRVRCGAGMSWGELNDLTLKEGLVTPGVAFSSVGVAGSTMGGGLGPLMGKFGLSCDNLLAAEVVTSDGEIVNASLEEDRELLWAIRGGGGNFGAVTSMEFRLHPMGEMYGGTIAWPIERAGEVLQAYRRLAMGMPDELGVTLSLFNVPILGPAVGGLICYLGERAEAEKALEPLFQAGRPEVDGLDEMGYHHITHIADDAIPYGLMNDWRSGFLYDLDDEVVKILIRGFSAAASYLSGIHLWRNHGAMSRVPPDATAFPHRRTQFGIHTMSIWRDALDNARNIGWTNEIWRDLQPYLTNGCCANFTGIADRGPRSIYGANLERLIEVKGRYDSDNIFRGAHNISPNGDVGPPI